MPKTLNEDEFAKGNGSEPVSIHNIVYGKKGWTDSLDDGTLDLLVKTGAVERERTVAGPGFETRIYVSVKGNGP